jgi:hypothetical protein
MMTGDQYPLRFEFKYANGELITDEEVAFVEFQIGPRLRKTTDDGVVYENGLWAVPVTQDETRLLEKKKELVQVRFKFHNGDIVGKDVCLLDVAKAFSEENI